MVGGDCGGGGGMPAPLVPIHALVESTEAVGAGLAGLGHVALGDVGPRPYSTYRPGLASLIASLLGGSEWSGRGHAGSCSHLLNVPLHLFGSMGPCACYAGTKQGSKTNHS